MIGCFELVAATLARSLAVGFGAHEVAARLPTVILGGTAVAEKGKRVTVGQESALSTPLRSLFVVKGLAFPVASAEGRLLL